MGGVKAVGGALEMVAGGVLLVTPEPTMATKAAGVVVAVHGADVASSGLKQVWTGEEESSLTIQGLQAAGMSKQNAEIVDASISIVGSGGSGALRNASKVGTVTNATAKASIGDITKNISKTIHSGKQGKHIVGHNNYDPVKSVLKSDAQKLLDAVHSGNIKSAQTISESKTRVDFGKVIGDFVKDGVSTPTTRGIIHNSKTGAHIVPSAPK